MSAWLATYILPYRCSTQSEKCYVLSSLVGSSIFMDTSIESLGRSANRGSTTIQNTAITVNPDCLVYENKDHFAELDFSD